MNNGITSIKLKECPQIFFYLFFVFFLKSYNSSTPILPVSAYPFCKDQLPLFPHNLLIMSTISTPFLFLTLEIADGPDKVPSEFRVYCDPLCWGCRGANWEYGGGSFYSTDHLALIFGCLEFLRQKHPKSYRREPNVS